MTGSSSTWYATSARLKTSRNSAARPSTLDVLKQLLRAVDDRVRLLSLQSPSIVDAPPRDGDRMHSGGLRGTDVEGGVADICDVAGLRIHPARCQQQGLRIGLVPLGLVAADDRLEQVPERDAGERELDRGTPLRRHDAEPPPLLVQAS